MVIAVDFDGTCVTNAYPSIGEEIGAAEVLREVVDAGNQLILFTLRDGKRLEEALKWFKYHKIPLWGVNKNPNQHWTKSPKVHADIYIDDAAVGCPVRYRDGDARHSVDWEALRNMLVQYGVI